VVWIDARRALVTRISPDGMVSSGTLERGVDEETAFLARVVKAIGDRARVVILGPNATRLALEREYVAIHHRPDRLIDVQPSGPLDKAQLERRVRELAA
jgi:hypothetical protein